jgi:hypothetical protein
MAGKRKLAEDTEAVDDARDGGRAACVRQQEKADASLPVGVQQELRMRLEGALIGPGHVVRRDPNGQPVLLYRDASGLVTEHDWGYSTSDERSSRGTLFVRFDSALLWAKTAFYLGRLAEQHLQPRLKRSDPFRQEVLVAMLAYDNAPSPLKDPGAESATAWVARLAGVLGEAANARQEKKDRSKQLRWAFVRLSAIALRGAAEMSRLLAEEQDHESDRE